MSLMTRRRTLSSSPMPGTVILSRTDGGALSISDISTPPLPDVYIKSASDGGAVSASDISSPPIVTGYGKTGFETPSISIAESVANFVSFTRTDTGALVVSDPTPPSLPIAYYFPASDSGSMVITENPGSTSGGASNTLDFIEGFEGTDGTLATTSNTSLSDGGNGTADGTMTFSATQYVRGNSSLKILNPIGSTNLYHLVSNPNVIYKRIYFREESASPSTGVIFESRNAGTTQASLQMIGTRAIRMRNGTTTVATFTTIPAASSWIRLEHKIDVVGGTQTARIFVGSNLHGTTPDEEITGAYSSTAIDRMYVGIGSSAVTWHSYMDAYAEKASDWCGPDTGGTTTVQKTPTDTSSLVITDSGQRDITQNFPTANDAVSLTVTEGPPNITGNALAYKTGDETPVITMVDSGIRAIIADQKSANDTTSVAGDDQRQSILGMPTDILIMSSSESNYTAKMDFFEDFEGGANGAAVTTANTGLSDGSNGTADGTMTFSTAFAVRGTRSMKISNPIGATNLWRNVSSPNVVYRRMYFRIEDASPGSNSIMDARNAGTSQGNIQLLGSRLFRIRNGTTTVATTTTVLAASTWCRVEHMIDTINGIQTARFFFGSNLHGTTPDETIGGGAGSYTGGAITRLYVGVPSSAATWNSYMDTYADGFTDWIGPG